MKGKPGNRWPILMRSAKSFATRFYHPKCNHAPRGAVEEGGKGNGPESWQMPAGAGVGAVYHVTWRWWTSWRPCTSESSRQGEVWRLERPGFLFSSSFTFFCQRGQRVVGRSSAIQLARLEGEGIRACHTLARVNSVWIPNNNNWDTMSLHSNNPLWALTMNQPATASKHHHEKPNHTTRLVGGKWAVASGKWQVASGEGWDVYCDLWMARWVYMYENMCMSLFVDSVNQ